MNKKVKASLANLSNLFSSREELSFMSESCYPVIELQGILPTTIQGGLGRIKWGELKKFAEFTFESFVEKYGDTKNCFPVEVVFHIEDFVFFRPSLKIKDNLFPEKGKPGYFRVSIGKFDNCLHFKTKNIVFETTCCMSGNLLSKRIPKYKISIDTKPFLVVKSKDKKLTENNLITAGDNFILLLSFLEERFIKHISQTIYYKTAKNEKPVCEFRHTHHSKPMVKPWREDLREKLPMDKFTSVDIKTMYLKFEKFNKKLIEGKFLELNLPAMIYLYLNAIQDRMVYSCINNFYACIEKLLKIAKEIQKDFEFDNTKSSRKHQNKVRKLCASLSIDYSDLLDRKGEFGYVQIRDDYIHNLSYKHRFEKIMDATDKARYLCRRIILTFLGLDYRNYDSCDPKNGAR